MAIRRPRIKPVANIGSTKRKIKNGATPSSIENKEKISNEDPETIISLKKEKNSVENENQASENKVIERVDLNTTLKEEHNISEDVINIPKSKTADYLNSPIKTSHENIQKPRQRIRATPCFDVRRNSLTTSSACTNPSPQTPTAVANNNPFLILGDNVDKSSIKDQLQQKQSAQSGSRTPSHRIQRFSESSGGGFLSPSSVQHNPPNFFSNQNHNQLQINSAQHDNNFICAPPSREHIPPRYRKISSMDDTQKLSSARKEFQSKYSRKSPEKSALKLCDFIFYNPSSNPMIFETKQENLNENEMEAENSEEKKEKDIENENKEHEEERAPVPQLKLGPNGEIILDEKSLVIETTAEKQAKSVLAASKSAIYLDEYSGNNGFYSRQKRTKDWTPDETIKFYRCLHTIGTDFSMMLSLFPNRSRRDLKLKFKKEERNNVVLVNKALLQPNTFDIDTLKIELEREEELAEERRKEESERKLKLQKKFENKILKHSKNDETQESSVNDNNKINQFYSRTKNILRKGNLAHKLEDTMISNRKKKSKNKIKADLEDDMKQKLSEEFLIKNESSVIVGKINKGEEDEDNSSRQLIENTSINEMDVDDIISVNSTNEFGYDELTGVEITDIGDILTLEDTLPEFKNSTLAIVSKHDKTNPENVTHGIYIICRATGIMSQKPLDLPEDTVNCILKAMGKI